jgi:simple sugar transport system ATP-binding protein
LIELGGIVKTYPGRRANDQVDLAIAPGEIHALLGENGAGKTTLVRIMAGLTTPDAGTIRWRGRSVRIETPSAARRLGIGAVFQHFTLFETLTVSENVSLGSGAHLRRGVGERIAALGAQYGLAVDPARYVHGLSVGERQRVEILRCLLENPELLIMDEPTAVLTPNETEALFSTLRRLAGEGRGILFISHKLGEVRELCDRATVLRDGRRVGECDPRQVSSADLARMMVGAEVAPTRRGAPLRMGGEMLRLDGLTLAPADPFGVALRDIDLAVRAGEIVGIAGIAGNGQSELVGAIAGTRLAPDMSVRIAGVPAGRRAPAQRRKLGLALVPEERIGCGIVPDLSLAENALLTSAGEGTVRCGLVSRARVLDRVRRIIERFGVVARAPDERASALSGGNLQKFILGRELLRDPRLLVAVHPTWGVDIGAASAIHRALLERRDAGGAILIVSEDLEELLALSDRIAVLSQGRLSPLIASETATREQIGQWMGGALPPRARDAA